MELARRIRGDERDDFRDTMPKDGTENFLSLPYKNTGVKKGVLKIAGKKSPSKADVKKAFKAADKDGSGTIDRKEFEAAIAGMK